MAGATKYEQYRANDLQSVVTRDPYEVMEGLYGDRYAAYRAQWAEAYSGRGVQAAFPLHLDVDLQDACNQRCNMCHQRYRTRDGSVISADLLRAVIEEGGARGLCALNFGASGEPLLQKALLYRALAWVSERDIMDTFLHTNGVLLDEPCARRLLDLGLKHLCVSIDAASAEGYEKTRNSHAFASVMRNVLRFRELRDQHGQSLPTVRVSFCVNLFNYRERDAFVAFWRDKADLVELQGYRHVDPSIHVGEPFKKSKATCANVFRRIMLWPNGDVSLCCGYRSADVVLGNVVDGRTTISALWQSAKMERLRNAFRGTEPLPATCQTCMDSYYVVAE